MDADAVNKTKEHYNSHANVYVDRQQALQARRQGKALPLKEFHNRIKALMINRFASGVDRLLDLACGRGGDIHKWAKAEIGYVKGIDLSPGEIEEATRRYEEYVSRRRPKQSGPTLMAEFMDSDQLGVSEWREGEQFNAVTCMFAIHYFFVSEHALDTFMHNVAINLKDGGYFFGTVPSGKRVQNTIFKGNAWPNFDEPMLQLKALWKGQATPFGCAYTCAIGDTVTQGVGTGEGSYEYLVFNNTLVGVAAKHGFKPLTDWGNPELDYCFDEADADQPIKHFHPRFPPDSDPSLSKASALFAAFAFQKIPARKEGDRAGKRKDASSGAAAEPDWERRRQDTAAAPAADSVTGSSCAGLASAADGDAAQAKGLPAEGSHSGQGAAEKAGPAFKRPKLRENKAAGAGGKG